MVLLAASICTRGGKAVLSRQFRDMPKSRVEALLASFPRLTNTGTQHTTVETDSVRYVYQPLEELYMVLITNRQSNILQDISTLHLLAQIVTSTCRSCNEAEILRNAFELISAFDEVCTLGFLENLTVPQIKNFLEMDSHEEKIQEIIEKNKELEANEERKRRAKQLEQQRKEVARRGGSQTNMGSSSGNYSSVNTKFSYSAPSPVPTQQAFESKLSKPASAPRGKGMALGKKSKQSDLFEAVRGEAEATPLMAAPEPVVEQSSSQQKPDDSEAIHVKISETLSAKANRDGGIESLELKGDLTLLISDREQGKIKVICGVDDEQLPGVTMKTHPNVDKAQWSNNSVIALRDSSKSFPIDVSIGVVRWSAKSTSSDFELPVTVTCWPNIGNGTCEVTVEFEHSGAAELRNVTVSIPLLNDQDPQIGESTVSDSRVSVNQQSSNLEWTIPVISQDNPSGSLEFSCAADDAEEFFPIQVDFELESAMSGLDVTEIVAANERGGGVKFSRESAITGTIQII